MATKCQIESYFIKIGNISFKPIQSFKALRLLIINFHPLKLRNRATKCQIVKAD